MQCVCSVCRVYAVYMQLVCAVNTHYVIVDYIACTGIAYVSTLYTETTQIGKLCQFYNSFGSN